MQAKIYKERAALYDDIRRRTPRREKVNVECSVILISACQDNQMAMDGPKNGLIVGHRERAFEHQRPFSIVVPRAAVAA